MTRMLTHEQTLINADMMIMRTILMERHAPMLPESQPPPSAPTMLSLAKAQQMAEFFKALADASRLRLLAALTTREMCVSDLAAQVEMSESAVSHQLRLLRMMRLVRYRKEGRKVFYALDDSHILDLYQTVEAHLDEDEGTAAQLSED